LYNAKWVVKFDVSAAMGVEIKVFFCVKT